MPLPQKYKPRKQLPKNLTLKSLGPKKQSWQIVKPPFCSAPISLLSQIAKIKIKYFKIKRDHKNSTLIIEDNANTVEDDKKKWNN